MSPVFKVTNLFFDRAAVIKAVGDATARVLGKAGAFIKRRAQTSMRYRKKSSPPGQPPSAHREHGARLRKLLFSSYDPSQKTVVVGPEALNNNGTLGATVPNVQEFGGQVVQKRRMPVIQSGRKATPAQKAAFRRMAKQGLIASTPRKVISYQAKYPPRAFMGPSLRAEVDAGRVLGAWGGAVRGAA